MTSLGLFFTTDVAQPPSTGCGQCEYAITMMGQPPSVRVQPRPICHDVYGLGFEVFSQKKSTRRTGVDAEELSGEEVDAADRSRRGGVMWRRGRRSGP